MGFFAGAPTIFGNLTYVRSIAAYVEEVKQIEIPLALSAGILFFKERERVQEIWLGCLILLAGLLFLIFAA